MELLSTTAEGKKLEMERYREYLRQGGDKEHYISVSCDGFSEYPPIEDRKPEKKTRKKSSLLDDGEERTTTKTPRRKDTYSPVRAGAVGLPKRAEAIPDDLPRVYGEPVSDLPPGELPNDITERVEQAIAVFCSRYDIEDMRKARQPQWSSCCVYIGESVYKSGKILHDLRAERSMGGTFYDFDRMDSTIEFWSYLCGLFGKSPMYQDCGKFCGLSIDYFDAHGREWELTPRRLRAIKAVQGFQEAGLSGMIADGRSAPTGPLAILNHYHGWTQSREVIHVNTDIQALSASELPRLVG